MNPLIGAMAASALPGAVAGTAPLLKTAGAFMLKNGMGAYGTYKLLQDIAGGHFTAEHAKALLEHLENDG